MQDLGPGANHAISVYCGMKRVATFNVERVSWSENNDKALWDWCNFLNARIGRTTVEDFLRKFEP
jgi:hypothetical protein